MENIEDMTGTISLPNLEDNIPAQVTKKEDAGDHLYRLAFLRLHREVVVRWHENPL